MKHWPWQRPSWVPGELPTWSRPWCNTLVSLGEQDCLAPCLNLSWKGRKKVPGSSLDSLLLGTWGRLLLGPQGNSPSPWRHRSALLGRWQGHNPHLGTKHPRCLLLGEQEIQPPQHHLHDSMNLWEAAASALGPRPLEKSKWSNPHQTFFGSGQLCGEVCYKDGRWIEASSLEQHSPEQMCQITSAPDGNKHTRASYQNAWSNLNETQRGPLPDQGPPSL